MVSGTTKSAIKCGESGHIGVAVNLGTTYLSIEINIVYYLKIKKKVIAVNKQNHQIFFV